MAEGVIYALLDPRPERLGQIRYIGKTGHLKKRQANYRSMIRKGDGHSPALRRWFKKLHAIGLAPTFKVLQECLFGFDEAEQAWIDKGRRKKWPLLNCREGGIGGSLSVEAKARISSISQARWADPAYVARWEQSQADRWGFPSVEAWKAARVLPQHNAHVWAWRKNKPKPVPTVRRAPVIKGDIAYVPLTRGKRAIIDAEDAERVGQYEWAAQHKGRYWRAKRTVNRLPLCAGIELLNRFIMRAVDGQMVTHDNGDQLDCRKGNLAVVQQKGGRPSALEQWKQRMALYAIG